MDSVFITTRKQRIIRELRDYMLIALGMLMYAIGWTVFLLPNDLPSGAVPGIASIVYWATAGISEWHNSENQFIVFRTSDQVNGFCQS